MKPRVAFASRRNSLSRVGVIAGCAAAVGIAAADSASALTVSVGQTVNVTTSGLIAAPFEMDGGELRIGNGATGAALANSSTDAILGRGYINHWYAQSGSPTFDFFGTTTVPGAPTGPFPGDGMYLRASPFDTPGASYVNRGTFVQSGTGQLTLIGAARFVGALFSTYFFDNDLGMQSLQIPNSTNPVLVNNGSSFIKRGGTGISSIDVPIEHTAGKFEVWSGSLALSAGGTYQNGTFYADPFASNPLQTVSFGGGTHTFTGFTRTETGSFQIQSGATARATTTVPANGGQGVWNQLGTLDVEGTLDIDGSVVQNAGVLQTGFTGRITGRTTAGGIGTLNNSGTFAGTIQTGAPSAPLDVIDVVNSGTFEIDAFHSVEVGQFDNDAGLLRVDGALSNLNGHWLSLLGGELQGTGIINGDVFVGGGPGFAVFRPGNSPGTMTINGSYTQEANGELELELAGNQPGQFDVVDASGGLVFNDGVIRFVNPTGYSGAVGDQIDFFAGRPVSIGPDVAIIDDTNLQLSFDPATGIATVPEPSALVLVASGMVGLVGLVRRRRTRAS